MTRALARARGGLGGQADAGQILVVAAVAMVAMVAFAALVLEGGNAFAQQRATQNGADAAANAGAVVLAERLGGASRTDAHVLAAVTSISSANGLTSAAAYYTDIAGRYLSSAGTAVSTKASAATVGGGVIPPGAQGVLAEGSRNFPTTVGRAIGFDSLTSSADATAVTGRLTGGAFLPVVFPINIVDCENNGSLGVGEENWLLSQPPSSGVGTPVGQEYVVPLCKTGGGSFMILDLDPDMPCDDEVRTPPLLQWDLPVDLPTDPGNDCAKKIETEVNARLKGKVVLIPVCDVDCVTDHGGNAMYHIVKVAAFYLDPVTPISDSNNKNNSVCQGNGTTLKTIAGNGSSSCLIGWFVRYITQGPVGPGAIGNSDAIGVQLIK